jgi:hypothetical protein
MTYQNTVFQLYFFSRNMMEAGALSIQTREGGSSFYVPDFRPPPDLPQGSCLPFGIETENATTA